MIFLPILLAAISPVSAEAVLAIMARIPAVEDARSPFHVESGHWERQGVAGELARAIASEAPDMRMAALLAVYAAFEGGNRRCVVGDGGQALGPFQLHHTPAAIACDPRGAVRGWLRLAAWSERACRNHDPAERLAALASGSCDRARVKVRARSELAERLADEVFARQD